MFYGVEALKMYFPEPSWEIPVVMIPPHPNDPLAIRDLLNKVQDPLMWRLQFRIGVVDDVSIQDKFIIFRNIAEKALEVLIQKVSTSYM